MTETFLVGQRKARKLADLSRILALTYHHMSGVTSETAFLSMVGALSAAQIEVDLSALRCGQICSAKTGTPLAVVNKTLADVAVAVYADTHLVDSGFRTYRGAWFKALELSTPEMPTSVAFRHDGWAVFGVKREPTQRPVLPKSGQNFATFGEAAKAASYLASSTGIEHRLKCTAGGYWNVSSESPVRHTSTEEDEGLSIDSGLDEEPDPRRPPKLPQSWPPENPPVR